MKRTGGIILIMLCCLTLFSGCGKGIKETITNKKIPFDDVTKFYYTIENINYNAFYQRYCFYREDGKNMFHHETREKSGEYGLTTEKDITKSGSFDPLRICGFQHLFNGVVRASYTRRYLSLTVKFR